MSTTRSAALLERARASIPGGVNSPVRAFTSVGGTPRFIEQAKGAYLVDADGNRYIDLINSWGPMILGHGHPAVVAAVQEQMGRGLSFGTPTELEIQLAEAIVQMVPGVEMVRLTNSGTEACMTAIRLARGVTGRTRIVKAAGCYHGHADAFLVAAGSGVLTMGRASSAGVPQGAVADTIVVPFNDLASVQAALEEHEVAAVIIEPVAGNMGCVPPRDGYLQGLRNLCSRYGTLLVFDEVMTGFRLAAGGAQELYGVQADLVTFGKVIGGGMPIGAVAGSRQAMEHLAPVGTVYQAGTLSGNPLAVTCGLATLSVIQSEVGLYTRLAAAGERIAATLRTALETSTVVGTVNSVGSMISVHFAVDSVHDLASAQRSDAQWYNEFFHAMLDRQVMLPPSAFESWFISTAVAEQAVLDLICEEINECLIQP
jgi:glutamate-1-semialdehyde 2,1-aminomutase